MFIPGHECLFVPIELDLPHHDRKRGVVTFRVGSQRVEFILPSVSPLWKTPHIFLTPADAIVLGRDARELAKLELARIVERSIQTFFCKARMLWTQTKRLVNKVLAPGVCPEVVDEKNFCPRKLYSKS